MSGPQMGVVQLARVRFHPHNVRTDLGDLRDLVASIGEIGILQPISVDAFPDFLRLRAGHRRVAAARIAGLKTAPAVIYPVPLNEEQFLVAALHENLHRHDLTPAELARAVGALKGCGLSTVAMGRRLGVSAATVRFWAAGADPEAAAQASPPPSERIKPASAATNKLRAARPSRARVRELADAWRPAAAVGLDVDQANHLIDAILELIGEGPAA